MNNTQQRPSNNGHQTQPAGAAQPPMQQAPQNVEPPKPAAPLNYRAEFLVETAEGFHVLIAGEELTPRDVMLWAKAASKELQTQGFKPVRRDVVINMPAPVAAAAAGPAAAAGGEATWIHGENGAPPKCSIHGLGKYLEGTYKADHPTKAGQRYAFWGCSVRGCRPKGNPT